MTESDVAEVVGSRLRALRAERGLSLGALAAAAGIGKGSLSEVERGVRNPTIGTLYALAAALGVPLSALLAESPGALASDAGIRARLLETTTRDGSTVEVYALELTPPHTHRSASHGAGVIEHLLVTRGAATVGLEGAPVALQVGEATSWTSDGPHSYRADGGGPAELVLTMWWPRS